MRPRFWCSGVFSGLHPNVFAKEFGGSNLEPLLLFYFDHTPTHVGQMARYMHDFQRAYGFRMTYQRIQTGVRMTSHI